MLIKIKLILGGTIFLTLLGCSSIISGPTQNFVFKSHPDGSKLYDYSGKKLICILPCSIALKRGENRFFIVRLEGYKSQTLALRTLKNRKQQDNTALLSENIVDGLVGAKYELQGTIEIVMEKEEEKNG